MSGHYFSAFIAFIVLNIISAGVLSGQHSAPILLPDCKTDSSDFIVTLRQGDFNKGLPLSPWELIQGRIPGLTITSEDGEPISDYGVVYQRSLNFLEHSKPYILVDGMPLIGLPLSINPNDIESITFLKDGVSAGLYGGQAANGVLLVKTHRAASDFHVHFTTGISVGSVEKRFDLLNANEYRELLTGHFSPSPQLTEALGPANTDWQEIAFQKAMGQDHYISISGTILKIPLCFSAGKTIQEGVIKTSRSDRTTTSLSVSPALFKKHLIMDFSINRVLNNDRIVPDYTTRNIFFSDPTDPVYVEGSSNEYFIQMYQDNVQALLMEKKHKIDDERWTTNLRAEYLFYSLPGLKLTAEYGSDNSSSETSLVVDSSFVSYIGSYTGEKRIAKTKNTNLNCFFTYTKDFLPSEINLKLVIGLSEFQSDFNYESYYVDFLGYSSLLRSRFVKIKNNSLYSGLFASLKKRYSLSLGLRQDDYSLFDYSYNKGNNLFPSVLLSWDAIKEPFLHGNKIFSQLNLYLSYGVYGNHQELDLEQFDYYDRFHLQQERISSLNAGISFGFSENKFTGTLEFYDKQGTNIYSPEYNLSLGPFIVNRGSLINRGVDVRLNYCTKIGHDCNWGIGYNFSYNSNLMAGPNSTGETANRYLNYFTTNNTGHPVNSYYCYHQSYDAEGYPDAVNSNADWNHDGLINDADKYYRGSINPKFVMGITSVFKYKSLDFSFSGRAHIGNFVRNTENYYSSYYDIFGSNGTRNIYKSQASARLTDTDYYIENASFFRMDYVSLGYNFKIRNSPKVNFYASMALQNAFVITRYTGQDPEVVGGIPYFEYPRPRTLSFKISADI